MEAKKPFHELVAEKLIEQLKAGTAPWQKPWKPGEPGAFLPQNPTTGKRYKGINTIQLMSQGHSDPRWLTYNQAHSVGAQVRKGEKGTTVQYWKFSDERSKLGEDGKPILNEQGKPLKETIKLERPRRFLATVFNAEQIEGLPPRELPEQTWNAIERAEQILSASGAKIKHIPGNRAFYQPGSDSITLPDRGQFENASNYYATALHELGHWTGHDSRLDRDLKHPFGSENYAKEELRAEISSMILGDELGIGHDPGQHASYVASWIKALEDDPLEVFRAASDAEKIYEYVVAFEHKLEQKVEQTQEKTQTETPELNPEKTIEPERSVSSEREPQNKKERNYLEVPFKEKEAAKALGARWDRQETSWYVPEGVDVAPFAKWSLKANPEALAPAPENTQTQATAPPPPQPENAERTYLAVPYIEKTAAKAAGAKWDKEQKSWYAEPGVDLQKLKSWLPGKTDEPQAPTLNPREEFSETLRSFGCVLSGDHPIMDGQKHRIVVIGDKKGETAGFYIGHLDGRPTGYVMNSRTGESEKWKAKGYYVSPKEQSQLKAEAANRQVERDKELKRTQAEAQKRVSAQMVDLVAIKKATPYLASKGIKAKVGIMTDQEKQKTYIPAFDTNGKHWTTQYISEDGTKRFAKGAKKQGCFHVVGGQEALKVAPVILIAEGYATAATLTEATGQATVVAFDSGNLKEVALALHEKFPDKPIIIAGDDDRHLTLTQGTNPGRTKAEEAAKAVGGRAMFPVFAPGENIYPADIPAITPKAYREHGYAQGRLEEIEAGKSNATAKEVTELKRALLSSEQLEALAKMKKYTDFNDLATKSSLGRKAVQGQVKVTLNLALSEHKKQLEQKQEHTQTLKNQEIQQRTGRKI